MRYKCALIVVEDINASRAFYKDLLGQDIKYDFGENIVFLGDFSIHEREHYEHLISSDKKSRVLYQSHSSELYFESDEIEALYQKLKGEKIQWIHPIVTHPWGQRVFRFYDLDHHVIEVGESMEKVLERLFEEGYTAEEIIVKSGMPSHKVYEVLRNLQYK